MIPLKTQAGRVGGLMAVLVSLGGIGLLTLLLIGIAADPSVAASDRILGIASVGIPLLLLVWVCYLGIRMTDPGHPAITLRPDHLAIEHRALFRRPILVPRSTVVAASVDVGTEGSFRTRERFRLERAAEDHADLPAWLYSKQGSPIPLIGHFREIPNLAVLFSEPIRFRGIRRVSRPSFRHSVRSPIRTKDVGGVMFPVEHAFLAEQALRAWGVPIRTLTTADAVALRPSAADRRRQAYRTAFTVGIGLLVLGTQAIVLLRSR